MLSAGEVDLIHECAARLGSTPVVINIGAGAGTSTLAFLESRPTAYVFEIDILDRPLAVQHTLAYADRLARIRGRSQVIGQNWPYMVDCVFVDGSHTDEAVTGDIEAWLPKIKAGGLMLFHDYHHPKVPGLTAVVDKYMADYERIGLERYLIAFQIGEK
jgi:precorrin-6B methylase 2